MAPGNRSLQEENTMLRVLLILAVAFSGNLWTIWGGAEEAKMTAATAAQCDSAGLADPNGCPRAGATADSGGLADPDGGSAP